MPFGPFLLQWRAPSPNPPTPPPLPADISRHYIPTSSGPLELLSTLPENTTPSNKPPLFFAHGGFGAAEMWLPYLEFFSSHGYPCYAISYRGHGNSWYPSFWRMYFTGRGAVAKDLVAGVRYAEKLEAGRRGLAKEDERVKMVLVAHSAGGALAQWVLSRGLVGVRGFCMCAAVPGFGSFSCYKFWLPQALYHAPYRLYHPRYILATTTQIRDAFFLPQTPLSIVSAFERLLAPYESMLWPLQGMFRFVKGPDVLAAIRGWRGLGAGSSSSSSGVSSGVDVGEVDSGVNDGREGVTPRLLVLAGERDVLCTPSLLLDAAQRYRRGFRDMVQRGEVEGVSESDLSKGKEEEESDGVMFKVLEGAPHHLQNLEPEKSAEVILEWVKKL